MAVEKHGILGQGSPAANTDLDIYTVPANRKATISTLVACNASGAATNYRVYARINSAAAGTGNRIASDVGITASASDGITWGICLGPGDVLTVRAANTNVAFTAFGVEEDLIS